MLRSMGAPVESLDGLPQPLKDNAKNCGRLYSILLNGLTRGKPRNQIALYPFINERSKSQPV